MAANRRQGLILGAIYGASFFTGVIWWIGELGAIAVIPLIIVQGAFFAAYGWWLGKYSDLSPGIWLVLASGGWAVTELIRYYFPVGGLTWGAAGYALSDQPWVRTTAAPLIGATGITVLIVVIAGLIALAATRSWSVRLWWAVALTVVVAAGGAIYDWRTEPVDGEPVDVAIVQGSTPCPFEHCAPDERLRTYQQHLELTMTIEPGPQLVVWSEGSTGSTNADPVQNPEVGEAIGSEASRLGAWILVGSDRPLDDEFWVNANVVFNPQGEIVGEYNKQHPVPFGERIPFRPLFEWIPDLDAVPRDMIPGEGPVLFDLGWATMGSVISFEGAFARYGREHVAEGANLLVVATNEGSYGLTPASDQLIGMTRMRAAELRVPVIHAAVTGKSVVIDAEGNLGDEISALGTREIVTGKVTPGTGSIYSRVGDFFLWLSALVCVVIWWRVRSLVGSAIQNEQGVTHVSGSRESPTGGAQV